MSQRWPGGLIKPTPITPTGPYEDGSASGVWTLDQMEYWLQQGLWPIAGNTAPIGLFGGSGSGNNSIQRIIIATTGNATDFGDLTVARYGLGSCSSATRGLWVGGDYTNVIDYVTIATAGNATDFGDMTQAGQNAWMKGTSALSNATRGVINMGYTYGIAGGFLPTIQYVTIATTGNATNFGDLLYAQESSATCASPTRGVTAGGYSDPFTTGLLNVIQYVTIASTGNATDFGDLPTAIWHAAGCSNSTRGLFAGGDDRSIAFNVINYITIATTGNSTDFGDLTSARTTLAACASSTRATFAGNDTAPTNNVIDYVTIATTGNATDFGDLLYAASGAAGCSSVHGGL